jgi:peptidoglycan/xylan/chitin deacetylase (PgdA/CDA1 family)
VRALKRLFLNLCETLGLFHLARLSVGKGLHILCYHGFQVADECQFRPQLFISEATFADRLKHLAEGGFTVLPLGEAVDRLRTGRLPRRAVVITIDDGFSSTLSVAARNLSAAHMPATVYVTTYYVQKDSPVFRLAVQYIFWKAGASVTGEALSRLQSAWPMMKLGPEAADAMWSVIGYGEALPTEGDRQTLLKHCADALGQDLGPLVADRRLSLLSESEVAELSAQGFDIQLHTHRHRFPRDDEQAACREITENREILEKITRRAVDHFCYPSGIFSSRQWPWLERLGVLSATTCLAGVNRSSTPMFGLTRFLDSEAIAAVEFRAELSGFNELIRPIKRIARLGSIDHTPID